MTFGFNNIGNNVFIIRLIRALSFYVVRGNKDKQRVYRSHVFDRATKKIAESVDLFCYVDHKLKRIISKGISFEREGIKKIAPSFFEFDYSNKDKLIINDLDANKKYIKHYECYYY